MRFSVFQLSRRGGREKNEDRMGYSYTRDTGIFVLADGMGGHPEGEVAAQIALQTLLDLFQRQAQPKIAAPVDFLASGLLEAHHEIIRYASGKAMLDTPRTTVVAALVQDDLMYWVHCGDSRLYVVREGALVVRTRDHSYAEAQVQSNITASGISRNVLYTCLGATIRPLFDVSGPMALKKGDKVMLCSDGLWGSLEESKIVRTLSGLPVTEAVPSMVDEAIYAAGSRSDNVTVVALEWGAQASGEASADIFATTELMDEGTFASTFGDIGDLGDTGGEPVAEMSEADIERSIAEINAAIQRTAPKKR
ncbi:MAG: protein phosphatase 2C domain-containing protein [Burkholderiaceae bacterium]|jgi:serine/threonine protein phosphatase PrpC|nr:protein phosphatase 2C domain-containing protein [Burkholderiaceae bacterium]